MEITLQIPADLAARMTALAKLDASHPDPIRRALAVIEADVSAREKIVRQGQRDAAAMDERARLARF